MIERDHALSTMHQVHLLGISCGAVYYMPRPTSAADVALMRRIDELHLEYPFMGARQLRRQLQREGAQVGRRHFGTLLQRTGIEAQAPQPGISQRAPGHKIYPYSLRKLAIVRSNQVPALETTYILMARGFSYLTAVVDVTGRRVLAHKVATMLDACHERKVIELAIAHGGAPGIVNTDQGSQFTTEFADLVLGQICQLSIDGRGARRDNVFVERLQRSVKCERVYRKACDSVSAARADIADYIHLYNIPGAHSNLDDVTPDEHYFTQLPAPAIAA